jgi:signal transduction histidine kinase
MRWPGMTPFKDQPLARKALTLGIVPTICALLVTSIVFVAMAFFVARDNIMRDTDSLVAIVADSVSAAVAFNDPRTASEVVNALRAKDAIETACVFDASGRLFASYARRDRRCAASATEPDRNRPGSIVRVHDVAVGDRIVGRVRLASNLTEVYARTQAQALGTLAALLVGALVAWALARYMRHWISHPVIELASTADRVSASRNYAIRATKLTDDEVGKLVDSFNAMLAQVQMQERVKDEFLAALSHELRTPLNAILGWLQIARTQQLQGPALTRALDRLERNARSQTRVVEDLLDVSRIVTGKLEMQRETVDLRSVVTASVDAVTPHAEARRIRLALTADGESFPVSGDRQRLEQVFVNLLSNAVKFSHEGGLVTVAIEGDVSEWIVTVKDQGIGIAPDFLPHVFERFRQFDGSMTREHGGLGLGLAIAKDVVDLHDGSIYAHSDGRGRGSTFIVRLPHPRRTVAALPQRASGTSDTIH